MPILQDHDVDLVLMGHNQVYARGYDNEDRMSQPAVTDGPVYVLAHAGAKHRSYLAERGPDATTSREVGAVFDELTISKTDGGRKRWSSKGVSNRPVESRVRPGSTSLW